MKIEKSKQPNLNSFKLTIPPYTPEFNPVELLFSKLKFIASDGAEKSDLLSKNLKEKLTPLIGLMRFISDFILNGG